MNDEYKTCVKCQHPLVDNQLVKDAYIQNTIVTWALNQLRILEEMTHDKNLPWVAAEVSRIRSKILTLNAIAELRKHGCKLND